MRFAAKLSTIAVLLALAVAVLPAPATAQPPLPHAFYGSVEINEEPAPVGTEVEARGEGVRTGIEGNPITAAEAGKYGGSGGLDPKLVVQGDIENGTPIEFYVNGVRAQCYDPEAGEWVGTYPFESGGVTELNLGPAPAPGPAATPTSTAKPPTPTPTATPTTTPGAEKPSPTSAATQEPTPTKVEPTPTTEPTEEATPASVEPSPTTEPTEEPTLTSVEPSPTTEPTTERVPAKVEPSPTSEPTEEPTPTRVEPLPTAQPTRKMTPTSLTATMTPGPALTPLSPDVETPKATSGPQLAAAPPPTAQAELQLPVVESRATIETRSEDRDDAEEAALGPYLAAGAALLLLGGAAYAVWRRPR